MRKMSAEFTQLIRDERIGHNLYSHLLPPFTTRDQQQAFEGAGRGVGGTHAVQIPEMEISEGTISVFGWALFQLVLNTIFYKRWSIHSLSTVSDWTAA